MATPRAPKQWALTKTETVNTYENWKQNLQYTLSLDPNFAPFLIEGFKWTKKTKADPLHGFTDDGEDIPQAKRQTAAQKSNMLDLMLGQIANYCPIISRNTIVKSSTCMTDIWQAIRQHFGFQTTGGHFLDFINIKQEPGERPEDLYQRIMAFVDDNLLTEASNIRHHGETIDTDEELTPTLENVVVLTWLKLLHPELPRLVKQRYGTELRSQTLASIKPEISQALESLLDEVNVTESARAMRAGQFPQSATLKKPASKPSTPRTKSSKSCPLCKQVGRPESQHFLSECPFLPEKDRKYIVRARQITNILSNESDEEDEPPDLTCALVDHSPPAPLALPTDPSATRRVQVRQSPYFDAFYKHHASRITLDTGAEGDLIREDFVRSLGKLIRKTSQGAHQADGHSPLNVVGETSLTFTRDDKTFFFEGLVVKQLDVDILAGIPFMEYNDITVRPKRHEIILADGTKYFYGPQPKTHSTQNIRRTHILRAPSSSTTIWPGDFLELTLPADIDDPDITFALEPRTDAPIAKACTPPNMWPRPAPIRSVAGKIRVPNLMDEPLVLKRHEQFAQIRAMFTPSLQSNPSPPAITACAPHSNRQFSSSVNLDPDHTLSPDHRQHFQDLMQEYDEVFDPKFPGYNGAVGPFEAVVNMGPVQPPQRKGRLPQYAHDKLQDLQDKFDELERMGVFARPEDLGITVEYLNPSFLIKKPNGGFRLVTAFGEVGKYSKPQPSLMPDVDSTLRTIAKWKYLIATDLTSAFYQIPLSKRSLKYCGVVTPFRGVRVYTRSAMGMPGSETALEELMCRVLGDLLKEGVVAKLADDLYCGGNTVDELLHNWRLVLQALYKCHLRLSAAKTTICPKNTTILGWIWSNGTIRASPHRLATLHTCVAPGTVRGLRSFIGAYKVLARVIPDCSKLLGPLDEAVAGLQSQDKISWSDELLSAFHKAQEALTSTHTITLPQPNDQLWIVTDGSVKKHSIGSTMYVTRNGKPLLAGFFSAKLRGRQPTWLPCEVEALSISASIKHFSPYIIQSKHNTCILTDSKPCVQAYEKLCRGEFSASPRLATFLSTVSRYQASVRHLKGSANIPSDFASRNAPDCIDPTCQICSFVRREENATVLRISAKDILSGHAKLPFTSRPAWSSIQQECSDLRRTHAHLTQGTRPSKKATNIKDVKRYLNVASVSNDGLLVVRKDQPLSPTRECIVVPRQVLNGLLTALHIQLNHPSHHQLMAVTQRYFYALDMDKAVGQVTSSCHHCASLRNTPHTLISQSTGDPPECVGFSFAADVMRRNRQFILVLRETSTSFTSSCLIPDERHDTLRDALIQLCIEFCPLDGPPAVIRTDPAPGFTRLANDELLKRHNLCIEIGRVKNINKNPVAEKAVQELEEELLRLDPSGAPASSLSLSLATATLNSRIRSRGLSAREMWYQRDQFTNQQIPFSDQQMIQGQHQLRKSNHPYSERSKAPSGKTSPSTNVDVGDIVYVYSDRDKSKARPRYLVTDVDGIWCNIRKFIGSQLRNTSYRVKTSECFKVPNHVNCELRSTHQNSPVSDDENEEDTPSLVPRPPDPPVIPSELTTPHNVGDPEPFQASDSCVPSPSPDDTKSCGSSTNGSEEFLVHGPESMPRRSTRQRHSPPHLKDYVVG